MTPEALRQPYHQSEGIHACVDYLVFGYDHVLRSKRVRRYHIFIPNGGLLNTFFIICPQSIGQIIDKALYNNLPFGNGAEFKLNEIFLTITTLAERQKNCAPFTNPIVTPHNFAAVRTFERHHEIIIQSISYAIIWLIEVIAFNNAISLIYDCAICFEPCADIHMCAEERCTFCVIKCIMSFKWSFID